MAETLYTKCVDIMKNRGFMCATANCWSVKNVLEHNNKWYCLHCLMNTKLQEWKKHLGDNWYDPNIHSRLYDDYNTTLANKVFKYEGDKCVLCYRITVIDEDDSFSCITMPFHKIAAMSKTTFYVGDSGFYMRKNYTCLTDVLTMFKTMLFGVRLRYR